MSKEFVWNADLVKDFCEYAALRIGKSVDIRQQLDFLVEDFKESRTKKPVLFTTMDGKEIFSGDIVSWVVIHGDNSWTINTAVMSQSSSFNHNRTFSTKLAAEEYILMNKPILSLQDLLSVWYKGDSVVQTNEQYMSSPLFRDFKELAKSKLK